MSWDPSKESVQASLAGYWGAGTGTGQCGNQWGVSGSQQTLPTGCSIVIITMKLINTTGSQLTTSVSETWGWGWVDTSMMNYIREISRRVPEVRLTSTAEAVRVTLASILPRSKGTKASGAIVREKSKTTQSKRLHQKIHQRKFHRTISRRQMRCLLWQNKLWCP